MHNEAQNKVQTMLREKILLEIFTCMSALFHGNKKEK